MTRLQEFCKAAGLKELMIVLASPAVLDNSWLVLLQPAYLFDQFFHCRNGQSRRILSKQVVNLGLSSSTNFLRNRATVREVKSGNLRSNALCLQRPAAMPPVRGHRRVGRFRLTWRHGRRLPHPQPSKLKAEQLNSYMSLVSWNSDGLTYNLNPPPQTTYGPF